MRIEDLLLLRLRQPARDLARAAEWILEPSKPLDERGPALEQLRQLLDRQLPR
jgi:hypothetical protein